MISEGGASREYWEMFFPEWNLAEGKKRAVKEKELVDALKSMLGIYAKVTLVAPKTIARSEGKAVRVIDKRHLY